MIIDLVRQIYESPDSDGSCAECCWGSGKGTIASVDEERQMVITVNPFVRAMRASSHEHSGIIQMTSRKATTVGCGIRKTVRTFLVTFVTFESHKSPKSTKKVQKDGKV